MISRKYSAPAIQTFSDQQLQAHTKGLILKIQIITGWQLPEVELMPILIDQLSKKLIESYPTFNINEVEYAFRSTGAGIKDWGKSFNLSLLDEVMIDYQAQRLLASQVEEKARMEAAIKPKTKIEIPKRTPEETIAAAFEVWKIMPRVDFIMPGTYYALKTTGLLIATSEQKESAVKKAREKEIEIDKEGKDYFRHLDRAFWLQNYARKILVHNYFTLKMEESE